MLTAFLSLSFSATASISHRALAARHAHRRVARAAVSRSSSTYPRMSLMTSRWFRGLSYLTLVFFPSDHSVSSKASAKAAASSQEEDSDDAAVLSEDEQHSDSDSEQESDAGAMEVAAAATKKAGSGAAKRRAAPRTKAGTTPAKAAKVGGGMVAARALFRLSLS